MRPHQQVDRDGNPLRRPKRTDHLSSLLSNTLHDVLKRHQCYGGGYGAGDGTYDPVALMRANENAFVAVIIQYRLGAFGFLSSREVHKRGVSNAGLLDQRFAFEWVQKNINLFGGDVDAVTISGHSAGGGSVMLHAIAYDGKDPEKLFTNLLPSSPYLPQQYHYDGSMPTDFYNRFVQATGCAGQPDIFGCLVGKDTATLQKANYEVTESASALEAAARREATQWQTAADKRKNKDADILRTTANDHNSQSTANEGPFFTPHDITTNAGFVNYIHTLLPLFNQDMITRALQVYDPRESTGVTTPFSTTGTSPPTALYVSDFAVGPQQQAYNLNAEVTFSCIAYWLAEAFSGSGRTSWKYEYSIPPAFHAADLFGNGWLFDPTQNIPADFARLFRQSWGNFIIHNNPGWKPYSPRQPVMQNFNVTGGFAVRNYTIDDLVAAQAYGDVTPDIKLVDAYNWEGGRGKRCEFWRQNADAIPA
ncbi:uncharacterized protein KY384_007317 [Bacidia gigantensis]|uniref:uncharacterized protein n=1 Tax=Bacidia gigantensis TaxID=2732470 RepID=UPI001D0432C4|nr:uncharacterized protein KY384_007317 [Bacidia gigantensis]KAG8528399.1 hypothetical protein KY384_007317 [Bacidia gigantensis]